MNLVRNCAYTANMDKHIGLSLLFALIFFGCDNGGGGGGDNSSSSGTVAGNSSSSGISVNVVYGESVIYGEQTYKTVVIGTQTWFAENLNYAVEGSKCYNDEPANCATYGRLYDWATAMALPSSCNKTACAGQINAKHQGICPTGWHIPNYDDWNDLMNYVGGSSTAGTKLKATSGWYSYSGVPAGQDTYGFAALPGGSGLSGGNFGSVGDNGYWWSATENGADFAYYRVMYYYNEYAYWYNINKTYLFSIRCVQD